MRRFPPAVPERNNRLPVLRVLPLRDAVADVAARTGLRRRMALRLCALRGLPDTERHRPEVGGNLAPPSITTAPLR